MTDERCPEPAPTPEQIEAVARAISPELMDANPADRGMAEEQENIRILARAAIAAYWAAPAGAEDIPYDPWNDEAKEES